MKLKDLQESMEFNACTVTKTEDGTTQLSPHGMREEEKDCWMCDGMAGNVDDYECMRCQSTGKVKEWVCDGPEMQVSNANGMAIVRDIIGQKADYSGMVEKKDLPMLRRKLIKMVNVDKERESMHQAPSDTQGPMGRRGSEGNVTSIGRKGPRMIGPGRSDAQVLSYAQTLLDMVEYAMKNDLVISWA